MANNKGRASSITYAHDAAIIWVPTGPLNTALEVAFMVTMTLKIFRTNLYFLYQDLFGPPFFSILYLLSFY